MVFEEAVLLSAPFAEVLERAKAALAEQGFGTLTEIDVAATLKAKIDKDMAPYVIIGACNPGLASRALDLEPQIGEGAEKTLGVTDARHRMEAAPMQGVRAASLRPVVQAMEGPGLQTHGETARCPTRQPGVAGTIEHHGVHSLQAGQRLPQRARREQPSVARTTPVEDRKLHIAGQAVVLQAVVAEQDIHLGMLRQQRHPGRGPVAADPDRAGRPTGKHQRLVTH